MANSDDLLAKLPESVEPPAEPDALAISEELSLPSARHLKLVQRQLTSELKRQVTCGEQRIERLETKVDTLQIVEVENAKYRVADRFSTLVFLICSPAILLGALFVDIGESPNHRGLGWGLLIVALGVQFLMGLFNPRI